MWGKKGDGYEATTSRDMYVCMRIVYKMFLKRVECVVFVVSFVAFRFCNCRETRRSSRGLINKSKNLVSVYIYCSFTVYSCQALISRLRSWTLRSLGPTRTPFFQHLGSRLPHGYIQENKWDLEETYNEAVGFRGDRGRGELPLSNGYGCSVCGSAPGSRVKYVTWHLQYNMLEA